MSRINTLRAATRPLVILYCTGILGMLVLLEAMVYTLEGLGFTSTETDFEPKKTEILAKLWDASDLLNLNELGFKDRKAFEANATVADREALRQKWN